MFGRKVLRSAAVGFTQVELLVVIGIIALLAAALLPSVEKARRSPKPVAAQRHTNTPASTTKSSPGAAPGDQGSPSSESPSCAVTAPSTKKRVGPPTADEGAEGPAPTANVAGGCSGDICDSAINLPSLPFSTSGNTCSCISDYDVDCPFPDTNSGGDVVFRFTPRADGCIDISLCGGGTTFDSKILLYQNVCNDPINCNDDLCDLQSELGNVPVTAGSTYYIVVDGYEEDCGDYHLEISPCAGPCDITCDPCATPELEPNCGLPNDTTNGGCVNPPPPRFTPLACGDTFCGTGAYNGNTRDTDWYKLVLDVGTQVTWTVAAEFRALVGIIETNGVDQCSPSPFFRLYTTLESCTTGGVSGFLPAGTWYLVVAPDFAGLVPCGAEYNAELTCGEPTPEACCLPDGSCRILPEGQCVCRDGTVVSHCPLDGRCIPPGDDCFNTPCGRTLFDFCNDPIPADFFAPGSEPFTGVIILGGQDDGLPDTRVHRFDAMLLDGPPETVPIELIQLSLTSCQPIVVTSNQNRDTLWRVDVDLSPALVPPGSMTAAKHHLNGGVFSATFHVLPRFTFTEVGNPSNVRVLDTGAEGRPPERLLTVGEEPWVHQLSPTMEHSPCGVNFVPGVSQNPQTLEQCCTETCHANPAGGHNHCTKQCKICPRGACCDAQSHACIVVEGAAACPGQYKGDGTNCADSDDDGIPDWFENNDCCRPSTPCNIASNPNDPDTDDDGVLDGDEVARGCDPCVPGCRGEACCLPLGVCVNNLSTASCEAQGGVPKGPGSDCLGDSNNDGIDDLCFDRPCAECGPGDHWIDQTPCPVGDPDVGGVCKFGGVNCLTNDDCTGHCRLNPGQNCLTDDDCTGHCDANPGQNCLVNTDCGGVCTVSGVNCATNADCTAVGDVCSGNVCLGRKCDNRICNKPNAMGQDNVPSGAVLGIDTNFDCIADTNIVAGGPVTIRKRGPYDDSPNYPGLRVFDGHKDVIDTEIIAMSLTGGGITLRAGTRSGSNQPLRATSGAIAEQSGDPALADSFFDVFFEIDRGFGPNQFLYNQTPIRVGQVIDCVPPKAMYHHLSGCTPLYASPIPGGAPPIANLVQANHFTYPACCATVLAGGCQNNISVQKCQQLGGTTVPTCLGDGNGNGRDDACDPKCEVAPGSPTGCTDVCPPGTPVGAQCLPSSYGCDPNNQGTCGVLACNCNCHLIFGAAGPTCVGNCPNAADVCPPVPLGDGSIGNPYRCACAPPPVCEPNTTGTACNPTTCPTRSEECLARCGKLNPFTGQITVDGCDCRRLDECHLSTPQTPGVVAGSGGSPCVVAGNGGGSVTLPPAGCEYLSPDEVHKIIDGLPAGTEIHLAPIHKDFICNRDPAGGGVCSFQTLVDCEEAGGSLGGEKECADSTLAFDLSVINPPCPGPLCGWVRPVMVPMSFETHTAPRMVGDPVQSFDTDMFRMFGQIANIGDPDFDLLRIVGGTDFGMPSPGHTTLTRLPGNQWAVDSFFDITYRIDFVGAPGGRLAGRSGSTTATIRMQTGAPFRCEGGCPAGFVCEEKRIVNADGTINLCCDCVGSVCETDPATGACRPNTCPAPEECIANCAKVTQVGGATTVAATDCHCDDPNTCHLKVGASGAVTAGPGGPCEVAGNGGGSVDLPPAGCDYLSPDDVHKIIDGLPAGTEIHLAPIHKDFICHEGQQGGVCSFPLGVDCREDGGSLGGEKECSDSTMEFQLTGTGTLAGWNRIVTIPSTSFETHIGEKKPFEPVQSFPTEMFRLFGQITNPGSGDPDFDLLRIVAGTDFGMPSPGHTTLTRLPNGNWAVDSFFDITYRIDFVGKPTSPRLSGRSGSTTGTIRMATNAPFKCTNRCPAGQVCVQTTSQSVPPDGTMTVCCDCVPTEACCLKATGACTEVTPSRCTNLLGNSQGPGSTCSGLVCPGAGDCNHDGHTDLRDFAAFQNCFTGPGGPTRCPCTDLDADGDTDLDDWKIFKRALTGP